jgi:hypothetical protein
LPGRAAPLRGGGEIDRPLPRPYELRADAREILNTVFRQQALFDVGGRDLSFITCRQRAGAYLLGIANNTWREQPLKVTSFCGPLESIRELPLDRSETEAVGYLPESVDGKLLGHNTDSAIRGGDFRVFAVRVKESGVEVIPHRVPPPRPHGRALPLRRVTSVKEEILARPTFFEHFDGVVLDWRYLHDREKGVLQQEAGWIRRQGLRVFVDLSSGVNLYPTLRLVDNLAADYEQSMTSIADVMAKMKILGSRDLILSLHRQPENNFSGRQTQEAFEKTLRRLAMDAAELGIDLHLRMAFGKPPWSLSDMDALIEKLGAGNLHIAAATALLSRMDMSADAVRILKARLGLWLAAAPQVDLSGRLWDAHAPLHRAADRARIAAWIALVPDAPILTDAVFANQDQEYLDAVTLEQFRIGTERQE